MPHIHTADGHRVHYRRHGKTGPHVVLLHGLGLAGDFWVDIPDRLAALEGEPHRALTIDNRGVGGSALPRRPFTMGDMADDVAAVLDAECVDAAVVVGISMGGMVAQHLALRHGHRVAGLVLMATLGGGRHLSLPSPAAIGTMLSVPFGQRRSGPPDVSAFARLVLPPSELPRAREHLRDLMPAFERHPVRLRAFFGQLGAVIGHLRGEDLSRIACPTLVMTGDADTLVPPRNSAALARAIPNARLQILPGMGHGIPILDRDAVGRAVLCVRGRPVANARSAIVPERTSRLT